MDDLSPDAPLATPAVERAILGALFIDPPRIVDIDLVLRPEDFTNLFHRQVWEAMGALWEETQEFDSVAVGAKLALGFTDNPGRNEDYLDELAKSATSTMLLEPMARELRQRTDKRQLKDIIGKAYRTCDNGQTHDEIRGSLEAELSKNADESIGKKRGNFIEALDKEFGLIESGEGPKCIPTGYLDFDTKFGGIPCGAVTYLGSRPSVGKSSLAYNIMVSVAQHEPVAIFTFEVREESVIRSIMSIKAAVSTNATFSRRAPMEDEMDRLKKAYRWIKKCPITVFDKSNIASMPVQDIKTRVRQLVRSDNCRLFIIDYLQQVESGLSNRVPENQRIAHVCHQIQGLAMETGAALLVLSQFNRDSEKEDRENLMADFRGSGAVEEDAHVCLALMRRQNTSPSIFRVLKYKNGPVGQVKLHFDQETLAFMPGHEELAPPPSSNVTYVNYAEKDD